MNWARDDDGQIERTVSDVDLVITRDSITIKPWGMLPFAVDIPHDPLDRIRIAELILGRDVADIVFADELSDTDPAPPSAASLTTDPASRREYVASLKAHRQHRNGRASAAVQ